MPSPAPYQELFQDLNQLRQRTARFRRVALHLHSPDSYDWGRGARDPARNDRGRFNVGKGPADFASELRLHVDLAAITDHMRCEFATRVSAQIAREDAFVVLPGMEVNFVPEGALTNARVHLLVILPVGSTKEAFAKLFARLRSIRDDGQRTGNEEVTGIPLKDWVTRVHGEKGICIAAHIDNKQGVRCRFRQTARNTLRLFRDDDPETLERDNEVGSNLREYLFQSGVDGIEVAKASDASHYCWVSLTDGTTRCIPTIKTSDAHCVEDFADKDRVTYVKMTRLGLDGLKDALAFPETRIRFPQDLPSPQNPIISGIQIIGEPKSFFDNVTIALTENLNCLIGARGSGKSTIVEALRYVFGYNRALDELEKLKEQILEMQEANLTDCLIRVVYKTSGGDERILEATYDPKSKYTTKVYTAEGEYLEVADVEACGDYPLRLYGWSEIELIGRSPSRQRALLDRFIPQLDPVLRERTELRRQLRDNRAAVAQAMRNLKSAFEKSNSDIRRFKEYQADFDKLNTAEVQALFSAFDFAHARRSVLVKVKTNIEQILRRLGDPAQLNLRQGLDSILGVGGQLLSDWWLGAEISLLGLLTAEQAVQGSLREAIERLGSFGQLVDQHIASVDREISTIEQELRSKFAADTSKQKIADLRTNAKRRLQHVSGLRDSYLNCWEALENVLNERKGILDNLIKTQRQIAGIRAEHNTKVEGTLNQFLPETMQVSIHFRPGGDRSDFTKAVTPLLSGAPRYKARNLSQVVAENYNPIEFAQILLPAELQGLAGKSALVDGVKSEFSSEDVGKIAEVTNPVGQDDAAAVKVLAEDGKRLERLLDLEEVEWDDYEEILLNGRPVNEMSPGQRSSAMLPLVALAQETPLLIDQPEDNVDKKLLGGVLANVLAHLKERRQIIVCTHDPNILVGGDAEQVVVMEAVSDRKGKVANHGSIDNPDIVQTVIDILEGGKEAFEGRSRRYKRCATGSDQ